MWFSLGESENLLQGLKEEVCLLLLLFVHFNPLLSPCVFVYLSVCMYVCMYVFLMSLPPCFQTYTGLDLDYYYCC